MTRIGIIGYKGNMGKAIFNLMMSNGQKLKDLHLSDKISESNNINVVKESDVIFICVKPEDMKNVIKDIEIALDIGRESPIVSQKLFVSCAAFIPMSVFETNFTAPTVRFMGNLLISEKKGSVSLFPNNKVSNDHLDIIKEICKGPNFIDVKEENLIDVSTIISGCMPAFMSYISAEYINFAISNGFTKEEALLIYKTSIEGTLNMLEKEDSELIINKVATKGGVTAKGLEVLKNNSVHFSIRNSLKECMQILQKKD